ncbi:MAG: hypothetical protein ACKO0Z_09205 [Betaproteobacteria bacterium]
MTSRSMKGYRTIQKMENGKLVIKVEKIKGYGLDASAKRRQRKSKRVKAQNPMLSGLFTPKGK